jgi:hypothetical protein
MSIKKEMTLKKMVNLMNYCNKQGYNSYVEGRGDGNISLIIEENFVTLR